MSLKTTLRLAVLPTLLVLSGCGGGGGGNPTGIEVAECSVEGQNDFVYNVMNDLYLYYDQIPNVNPRDYDSPRSLLEAIRAPNDRFSFIADREAQTNFFEEGTYNGLGFSFRNNEDDYTITLVYDDSSAGRAGLKRSDKIISVNGISVSQLNDDGGLNAYLSNFSDGSDITFLVEQADANPTNIVMNIGLVRINTVLKTEVITANTLKVGYLAFSSFIEPSKAELKSAFNTLQQQDIDELVLDLRYNGGGRVDVSQILASYIAGDNAVGADATRLVYNDKNSDLNSSFPFVSLNEAVNLDRLYVLTLGGTCSASEIVINAMQPVGIDVVTIGQTTCGKPVGSRNINFCDKTLSAISFDVVNDINQGGYFDGIPATCAADDDLKNEFGNPSEAMFATALYHIENGQCPTASRAISSKAENRNTINTHPADIMKHMY